VDFNPRAHNPVTDRQVKLLLNVLHISISWPVTHISSFSALLVGSLEKSQPFSLERILILRQGPNNTIKVISVLIHVLNLPCKNIHLYHELSVWTKIECLRLFKAEKVGMNIYI
jgi:hypothetical protein